ncbi:DUF4124 domain-containing protein [Aliivibrio finisterrensis]|uniref:DUF4124 domain-containing protein n=1 Tax=Aliivibrio finisterrensis TaxID=511998 RepID=UPI001021F7FF|nr:DUF4124 domain-containing protein [Aliivibrio finisterrensis]RYU67887.1 DUF4124 domain-containing protein [Aliivibrio finisterrensis]RYU71545.1 DUF4124 domain-containing protein [Aliivibrio finisterrensis]RYU74707.1 DUF4124 domain-containing protein [Aliivibrio finisterrensis]
MRYIFFILFSLLSASIFANTIYTWEDSKGVRHFSDSAPLSKEPVTTISLSPTTSLETSPAVPEHSKKTAPTTKPIKKKLKPLAISVTNLQQEETIRSSRGHITVLTELTRKLSINEKLQLLLDGAPYGPPQTSTEWKLKNINRGTHLITVIALKDGKRIASSPIITVFLHRPSAN